jgi:peptidoglycan/xylan/chitin deacetylase (PgdA/CDA1 family)
MFYFVKTPGWLKKLYAYYIWDINVADKTIYLSFDDGPHPAITGFVLDELKKYNAHATFFCIGKNVLLYPAVYKRILEEGHATGNHTQDHLNGWKTPDEEYIENIEKAKKVIDSNLFRPPYGRIKRSQFRQLAPGGMKIIMWDVLSGDFDMAITKEKCLQHVLQHTKPGSVIVFHDSEKANERMSYALPGVLKYFSEKGYSFGKIAL